MKENKEPQTEKIEELELEEEISKGEKNGKKLLTLAVILGIAGIILKFSLT